MEIKDTGRAKQVRSPDYNYVFDRQTGLFARWGKSPATEHDPVMSPSFNGPSFV